jgi:hypothetical protein
VAVVDLGDRGHVDGVVEPPVPAPGQPVDLTLAGGDLDRRGAVVCGHRVDVLDNLRLAVTAEVLVADHRPGKWSRR